jgi:hypothetical protein
MTCAAHLPIFQTALGSPPSRLHTEPAVRLCNFCLILQTHSSFYLFMFLGNARISVGSRLRVRGYSPPDQDEHSASVSHRMASALNMIHCKWSEIVSCHDGRGLSMSRDASKSPNHMVTCLDDQRKDP